MEGSLYLDSFVSSRDGYVARMLGVAQGKLQYPPYYQDEAQTKQPTAAATATPTPLYTPTPTPTFTPTPAPATSGDGEASTERTTGGSGELTGQWAAIMVEPMDEMETNVRTITYTYDALNRPTAANYNSGMYYHYTYDAVGNRLEEAKRADAHASVVVTEYTYDDANRLTGVNGANYTWDANGNLLSESAPQGYGVNTYTSCTKTAAV